MPGVVNYVQTHWTIKDAQAIRAAKRMQRQFQMVSAVAASTSRSIGRVGRMFMSPFGAAVGAAGAFGLVKHLLDVGKASEDAKLSLTSLLQQASGSSRLPFSGFTAASEAAVQLRKEFRRLAVDSPATSKSIQQGFEDTTFFLSKAGLSLEKQASFARDIAVLDKQLGGQGVAGRDVAQLLRGDVGGINAGVLKAVRFDVQKLVKKGDLQAAADLIQKKIAPDPKLLEAYGNSFGGLVSSMTDQFTILKEEASKPLMNFISKKLKEWLKWLKANKRQARAFAREVGKRVVQAVKAVIRLVKFLARNWDTIVSTVTTLVKVWIGGRLLVALGSAIVLARKFKVEMAAANAASIAAGGGKGKGLSKLAKLAVGAVAVAAVATYAEDIGKGVAEWATGNAVGRTDTRTSAGIAGAKIVTGKGAVAIIAAERAELNAAQRDALTARAEGGDKKARSELKKRFEVTIDKRGGGGGGGRKRMKVGTLIVDKMSARDRDFARLSTPGAGKARRESFARRPLAGLGLAVATVGR